MDLTLFFVDSLRKLLSTEIADDSPDEDDPDSSNEKRDSNLSNGNFLETFRSLREVLCCAACGNLLSKYPLVVADKCNHFICRSCLRCRDRETFCQECYNWEKFDTDPTLSCFVSTYKAFCEFVLRSDDMRRIVHLNPDSPLFEIVKEGCLRDEELVFQRSMGVSNDNNSLNEKISDETGNDIIANMIWIKSEEGTSPLNTSRTSDSETEVRTECRYRKQTWSESTAQTLDVLASSESSNHKFSIVGSVVRTDESTRPIVKKLKVRLPKQKTPPKLRRGCRCGNASVSGKLTCCGQRCPCYVDARACHDCRCKGCRNPHLPGGKKLLQGINTVIDTKSNLAVQLPSSSSASQLFHSTGGSSFTSIYPVSNCLNASFSFPTLPVVSVSQSQHSDQKKVYDNDCTKRKVCN